MPGSTDTRIIQMQFDNKEFEKNIAVSQESLEKFKDELDFDKQEKNLRNFGEATKKINFETMAANLQKLTDKFTGLGTVSELILSQIRREIEGAAASMSNFIKSMTTGQISSGQEKFNQLTKSIRTIMNATDRSQEDVYARMNRLNKYTDMTSYSFSEMASSIGKFTSVGIGLEEAEEMMEGIANWAAQSGQGINEANRAMYNLSQAMSIGKLTSIDWKSIAGANMATKEFKEELIKAGLAMGTLVKDKKGVVKTAAKFGKQIEVTYQNVDKTLNKGWATNDVLGNTLFRFQREDLSDGPGKAIIELSEEHQKAIKDMIANDGSLSESEFKTFSETAKLTDEQKQKILDLAVKYKKVQKAADGTYSVLDKNGKAITFTLKDMEKSLKTGWFDEYMREITFDLNELAESAYESAQKCMSFTDVLNAWKDQISTGFMQSFQHIFGQLSESMELFSNICNKVSESFGKVIRLFNGGMDEEGTMHTGILEVWGESGRESLWQNIVGEYGDMYKGAIGIIDILQKIGDMISKAFYHFIALISPKNITGDVLENNEAFRNDHIAQMLYKVTDGFQDFLKQIQAFLDEIPEGSNKSRLQMIQDILNGIAATVALAWAIIKRIIWFAGEVGKKLEPSFTRILELFSKLGLGITNAASDANKGKGLTNFFVGLLDVITPVTDAINFFVDIFVTLIESFVGADKDTANFGETFAKFGEKLKKVIETLSNLLAPIIKFLGEVVSAFTDMYENNFDEASVQRFQDKVSKAFTVMFDGLKAAAGPILHGIAEFFKAIWNVVKEKVKAYFEDENTVGHKVVEWVKQAFNSLLESLDKIFPGASDKIKGFFKDFWGNFQELIGHADNPVDAIKNLAKKIGDWFSELFKDGLGGAIKKVKDAISNFFSGLFGGGNNGAQNEAAKSVSNGLKSIVSGKEVTGQATNSVLGFSSTIFDLFGVLKDKLGPILSDIWEFIKGVGPVGWAIAAAIAGLGALIVKIVKLVKNITGDVRVLMKDVKTVSHNIAEGSKKFWDGDKAVSWSKKLLMVAIAIGIMAAAVYAIGQLKLDQAAIGVGAIAILFGLVIAFIAAMKKITDDMNNKDFNMIILAIVASALAVGKLVKALLPLAQLEWDQLAKMGAGFVVLSAGLTGMLLLISRLGKKMKRSDGTKMFKIITGIAIGMWIMIKALMPLATLEWDQLAKMGAGFVVISGAILGMLFAMTAMNKNGALKKVKGVLTVVLAFVIGVWGLVQALLPLAALSWGQLIKVVLGFVVLSGGLLGMLMALMAMNKKGGLKNAIGILVMVIAIVGGIYALVQVITPLANMRWSELIKMSAGFIVFAGGLTGMIAALTAITKNSSLGQSISAIGMVIAIALGIAGVIWALMPVANLSLWQIVKMMIAFGGIIAGISVAMIAVDKASKQGLKALAGIGVILAFAAASLLIAKALLAVKDISWKTIIAFTAGLTLMMVGIAVATAVLSKASPKGILIGLLALVGGLAAVMGVIGLIGPWMLESLAKSLPAFSDSLKILGEAVKSFGSDTSNLNSANITACVDLIKGVAAVQLALTSENISLAVFSALTGQNIEKGNLEAFAKDMSNVGHFVADFGRAVEGVDFSNASKAVECMNQLADVRSKLTFENIKLEIFKKLLGVGIDAGDMTAFANDMLAVAPALKLVGIALEGTDFSNFDTAAKALNAMVEVQGALNGQAIALSIFESLTGGDITPTSLEDFSKQLIVVAPILAKVGEELSKENIDYSKFTTAADALKAMVDVQGALNNQAIALAVFEGLTGGNIVPTTLENFTSQLLIVAPILSKVGAALAKEDIDYSKFKTAAEALKAMVDVQGALNGQAIKLAIFEKLTGGKIEPTKLDDFANDLVAVAPALSKVGTELQDVEFGNFAKAAEAMRAFVDLQSLLNDNDIKTAFANAILNPFGTEVKTTDLTTFADQIVPLGQALAKFAASVSYAELSDGKIESIDTKGFTAAIYAIRALTNLQAVLPQTEGIFGWVTGHASDLPTFASGLKDLGEGIRNIYDQIYILKEGNIPSPEQVSSLGGVMSGLAEVVKATNQFGTNIGDFSFEHLATEVNRVINLGNTSSSEKLTSLAELLNSIGRACEGLKTGITDSSISKSLEAFVPDAETQTKLKTISDQLTGLISDDISDDSSVNKLLAAFRSLISKFATKVMEEAKPMVDVITTISNKTKEDEENNTISFKRIGEYLAEGMAEGIKSGTSKVIEAAIDMVKKAKTASMEEADENSPSKLFMMIGGYLSSGMAIGITNGTGEVENAASNMVTGALDGSQSALTTLQQILNGEFDGWQPKITPVLDLTNIQNGSAQLGNLFGDTGINLTGGAITIDPRTATLFANDAMPKDYTESIARISEEIGSLRTDIKTMGEAMKNLKLVMNSGAVVGAIGPDMDQYLGQRGYYVTRTTM